MLVRKNKRVAMASKRKWKKHWGMYRDLVLFHDLMRWCSGGYIMINTTVRVPVYPFSHPKGLESPTISV